ncbi:5712_t:CDS:2 [Rhizophagus irregularis]|nr:5712_t:CDS:2 [Rhizophagus irregularis]
MDNEQPTNRTIDATQMERALSKIPCDNLNISCDFSDTTPSYVSFAIRRRRNQRRLRRLRHEITINIYLRLRLVEIAKSVYGKIRISQISLENLFTF